MKIISYNVNGIRAACKKGFAEWFESENPDILCLQETKAQPEKIDQSFFHHLGYHTLINSAVKKGYSGVAVISKRVPDYYSFGINIPKFDNEGRVIRADFGKLTVVCVYIPSGTTGDIRQAFKMEFLDAFAKYLYILCQERPELLVCGDFNICHKPIDINHPERHQGTFGFLPEERNWFDNFINSGFVDTFREFDQSSEKYSWWTYWSNARARNVGWRIDYHIVTNSVKQNLLGAAILSDVVHSDHCPVLVNVDY